MRSTDPIVRDYRPADAAGWVRCRALAFLGTQYYDDVHPVRTPLAEESHQGGGIGTRLLEQAVPLLLARSVRTLDAWTREDKAANSWYRRNGFSERYRYLHVYLGDGDDATGFTTPEGLSAPVSAFVHASIEDEATMRERYRRVYLCRQYLRELDPANARPEPFDPGG